jgi:peptidoglycan/LPS O-acetylase OafA/YrhL
MVVILVFPVIIYLGARGNPQNAVSEKICTFLGDISYPIYILHFPFTYVFYAWVINQEIPIAQGTLVGIGLLVVTTGISYAALKLYDEPVRQWLTKRLLRKPNSSPPTHNT